MFHHDEKKPFSAVQPLVTEVLLIESYQALLSSPKRKSCLKNIQESCAFETNRFQSLCLPLIHSVAKYYQHLPESQNYHYMRHDGWLDYALNKTAAALALFRDYCITDQETHYSHEQQCWLYALFSASMLQGIGKLSLDYKIIVFNQKRVASHRWNPLIHALSSHDYYYQYELLKNLDISTKQRLTLLFAQKLMPAEGLEWIASHEQILTFWLALLNEDESAAKTFGAILERAKVIATQQELHELLKQLKPFKNEQRNAHRNTFIDPETTLTTEQQKILGVEFIEWVRDSLQNGKYIINQYPYFMLIPGNVLMSPALFKCFAEQHPKYKNEKIIQQAFLSLEIHKKDSSGSILSLFEHAKKNKMLSGLVVNSVILPKTVHFHDLNTGTTVEVSVVELMHNSHHQTAIKPLEHLSKQGIWVPPAKISLFIQPGIKPRV